MKGEKRRKPTVFHCTTSFLPLNANNNIMDVSTLLILVLIGLFGGFVAGMVGLGGGIVIVPALVYLLGFSQATAQGTSLAMMLPPIGVLAAYNYWNKGMMDIKAAMIIAVVFVIGGYFGSKLAVNLPQATLKKIFGALLLVAGIKMIFGK